ncbi:hypothetical protein CMK18_23835 [Candidatus Poribacteria bacterium]|nr:hypothetical protein [Candidatus Poribacteria bacterium]
MKVKQTVQVRYSSAYSGYGGLEITDVDGTEINIKMTKDEWLDLEDRVKDKCDRIRKERQGDIDEIVEQRVAAELAKQEQEVE